MYSAQIRKSTSFGPHYPPQTCLRQTGILGIRIFTVLISKTPQLWHVQTSSGMFKGDATAGQEVSCPQETQRKDYRAVFPCGPQIGSNSAGKWEGYLSAPDKSGKLWSRRTLIFRTQGYQTEVIRQPRLVGEIYIIRVLTE